MSIDTSQFEEQGSCQGVTKLERTVDTPIVDEGYSTEKNTQTVYDIDGAGFLKVSKVSKHGWSVLQYDTDGEIVEIHRPYVEEENQAHEKAREIANEIIDE